MFNLKAKFDNEVSEAVGFKLLVTAVKLPTRAIEVITNTQEIDKKIDYLQNAYDNNFELKANSEVKIVGFMLV